MKVVDFKNKGLPTLSWDFRKVENNTLEWKVNLYLLYVKKAFTFLY